eukprot:NODE_121_length_2042_cov_17.938098.p1 GENE.NODE_121_length_2042_cov_17.938098~~NODE_121_length_2042_cov_17.938098.p1  ORF type:complete len:359 (+),score=65.68 NODE_121_length_2042_cov_17.938098:3-1079(+)
MGQRARSVGSQGHGQPLLGRARGCVPQERADFDRGPRAMGIFICFLAIYQGSPAEVDVQVTQGSDDPRNGCFARVLENVERHGGKMFVISNEKVLQGGLYSRLWCVWEVDRALDRNVPIIIHPLTGNEKHLFGERGRRDFNPEEDAHCGRPGLPMGNDEKRIRGIIDDGGWKAIADAIRSESRFFTEETRINVAEECKIGPRGIDRLFKAMGAPLHILTLDLSCNGLDWFSAKVVMEELKSNATLQWLYLHHNEIRDHGATFLGEALLVNRVLKLLDLRSNHIGDVGAKALANALKVNDALEILRLSDNEIKNDGSEAFADALDCNTTLRFLNLSANKHIERDVREALKKAQGERVHV